MANIKTIKTKINGYTDYILCVNDSRILVSTIERVGKSTEGTIYCNGELFQGLSEDERNEILRLYDDAVTWMNWIIK